jgi:hypothetical protein
VKIEPWLRGNDPGFHPVIGHLLRTAQHIREDAEESLTPLTADQIWARPYGMTPVGFHARHLAGSTHRLCVYLAGAQLSPEELAEIPLEAEGGETSGELMARLGLALARYEALLRELKPEDFGVLREVGRQRLPVTAIGLAIHIAEHGQRHVGQLVSGARLIRAVS